MTSICEKKVKKWLYRISSFNEKRIDRAEDWITGEKHFQINGNLWIFANWHAYKEYLKENVYKSKQVPGGKLSRRAGMKFNFLV